MERILNRVDSDVIIRFTDEEADVIIRFLSYWQSDVPGSPIMVLRELLGKDA